MMALKRNRLRFTVIPAFITRYRKLRLMAARICAIWRYANLRVHARFPVM
ncbi:MAG: hypothetical protein LBE74_02460 [Treponema sp.]|nr:hypothetical protein [Treponema sp.]